MQITCIYRKPGSCETVTSTLFFKDIEDLLSSSSSFFFCYCQFFFFFESTSCFFVWRNKNSIKTLSNWLPKPKARKINIFVNFLVKLLLVLIFFCTLPARIYFFIFFLSKEPIKTCRARWSNFTAVTPMTQSTFTFCLIACTKLLWT